MHHNRIHGDEQPRLNLLRRKHQTGIGVHNGLSTVLATRHNFDFLWVSSFEVSAAEGMPDAGFVNSDQITALVRKILRLSGSDVVVDLETGYGDPIRTYRAVYELADAGVAGVVIEDNPSTKRCSLYEGYDRSLATVAEQTMRIQAAILARNEAGSTCSVIARTEALVAALGVNEALRRAHAYADAGADAVFVQSADATGFDVIDFCTQWQNRLPIFLAPTKYPQIPITALFGAGATHVIFANYGIRAFCHALDMIFRSLKTATCGKEIEDRVATLRDVAELAGVDALRAIEHYLNKQKDGNNHFHDKPIFSEDSAAGYGSEPVGSPIAGSNGSSCPIC